MAQKRMRINWKLEGVEKTFLEACIHEITINGREGNSLKQASWKSVAEKLKTQHNFIVDQRQMKNHFDFLKGKFAAWLKLKNKTGNVYDPLTNTFNLSEEEWQIEMKMMDSATLAQNTLLDSKTDSQRTLDPYVTGTSVVGIKYKDGVLLAADMGGSYGSTLRYKSVERLKPVGKHSIVGASGEISDFQEIMRYLDELIIYDNMWDDGNSFGPKEVHNYLTRVMYNRRNKFDPLWNSLVLGGVKKGQKYLGTVNMIGVHYEDDHVATGFGNHLARPILREEWNENMSFEEGVKLLEKCMRVLLYRDRSAVNKIQIVKLTEEGATSYPPYSLKTYWGFSAFENPTSGAEGSW
ncbi:hypothetical protein DM860_000105 [Cuscuta australis]|uniref:Myb/SANT-like domain-containing protein n=1 Tax=Cuscuta australis TaxID=267555 RepID=A0A328CYL5_9ASTE|nr:hypothetical protein DM860_000105 [Cuscuta australis]